MATIKISDLHPAGSDLFSDSEGYMNELGEGEIGSIQGGIVPIVASLATVVIASLLVPYVFPLTYAIFGPRR
jgi:hypothetical protein